MNLKTTYALGVLAIIGGLVLLIAQPWRPKQAQSESITDTQETPVLNDAPDIADVDRLEIARPGEPKLAFARAADGTSWRIVEPFDAPAVDHRVRTAITTLAGLQQKRRYAAADKNRPSDDEAGVGERAVVATLHDAKTGKSHAFRIGTNPPLSSDTYVRLAGRDELLVVGGAVVESIAAPLEEFRNKRLLAHLGRDEVKRVRVEGAGHYELAATDGAEWLIESPVRARADRAKADSLVNAVRNLSAEKFVDDAPSDLARFALDVPSLKITLVTETKEEGAQTPPPGEDAATQPAPAESVGAETTLLIGGRAGDAYFAKLADQPWVFTVAARTRDDLAKPLDDLRDRRLFPFTKENATALEITAGGQSATLTLDGGAWKLDDGSSADLTAVDDLLKSARDLTAVSFVETETLTDPGLDPPRAVVAVTVTGEEAPLRLELGAATASGEMIYVRNPASGTTAIVRRAEAGNLRRPPAAYRSRDMLNFNKALANRLEIERDAARWVIEKGESEQDWRISAPTTDQADADAVGAILADLYNLRARAVAGVGNPADFGLDAPVATVTVRYQPLPMPVMPGDGDAPATQAADADKAPASQPAADEDAATTRPADEEAVASSQPASGPTWVEQPPVTHVLRIAERDGVVYATLDDGHLVYEIDRQILANLRAELLNRRVGGFETSQVVGVRFEGTGGVTELNRVGDAWQYADDPALPIATQNVTAAIQALADLKTERYYEPADLAAIGLDAPDTKVVITLDDHRTIELAVSDDGPDDLRGKYGRSAATGRVFVIGPDQLAAFEKTIADFKVEQK